MNEKGKAENRPAGENARKPAQKPAGKTETGGFCCYLGPTLTGFLRHGDILGGGPDAARAAAEAAIRRAPSIKTLIVSGDALGAAQIRVKTPGNALYEAYRRVLTEWKEGAGNG